jgi:hypothetical protein
MLAFPLRRWTMPAIILVAGLAGCAGSTPSGAFSPAVQTAAGLSLGLKETSGPTIGKRPHWLYVTDSTDSGLNAVKIFRNGTYKNIGTISTGILGPVGDWLDKNGNLYVANSLGPNVTEYTSNTTTPSFTYSQSMQAPQSVATDAHGNVFEADLGAGSTQGHVNEYAQGSDNAIGSCYAGLHSGGNTGAYGVAVDKNGDVFVSYGIPGSGGAGIDEYMGGLGSCNEQKLAITYASPGGVAVDAANDLVVCDPASSVVYVIPPPYISVPRTIGIGFSKPTAVTLSKDNTRAFVTDVGNHTVTIVNYQTGANMTVLGPANGLSAPKGAVDGPNAVY